MGYEFVGRDALALVGPPVGEVEAVLDPHLSRISGLVGVGPPKRFGDSGVVGEDAVGVGALLPRGQVVADRLGGCADGVGKVAVGGSPIGGQGFEGGVHRGPVEHGADLLGLVAGVDGADVAEAAAVFETSRDSPVGDAALDVLAGAGGRVEQYPGDVEPAVR